MICLHYVTPMMPPAVQLGTLLYRTSLFSIHRRLSSYLNMKIGVVQINCSSDKERNFSKCENFILEAKQQGAKMVFLPEAFDFLAESSAETVELAEPIDGALISRYRSLAQKEEIWLSLGGFHRKEHTDDSKVFNCHVVLNSAGQLVAAYNKAHLFDVDVPGRVTLRESRYVRPGASIPPLVRSPVGAIGLAICYDMRFAEMALALREMGAELLTFPSAFSVPTGEAGHWETLLRARAVETQCWVVAAAQCGRHNARRASFGHSLVVDPWGRVLANLGPTEEGVATVTFDREELMRVRQSIPVMQHRRTDLYPALALDARPPDTSQDVRFGSISVPSSCVFFRTARSTAFVNLRPVVPGHVLVAPLRPAARLEELDEAELCDLYRLAHHLLPKLQRHFGATSATLACQDGPEAGQTVKHVHLHILPRKKGDFEQNDAIYEKLEERDLEQERKERSLEQMAEEAQELRNLFFGASET